VQTALPAKGVNGEPEYEMEFGRSPFAGFLRAQVSWAGSDDGILQVRPEVR
jgi:hypothetical protein